MSPVNGKLEGVTIFDLPASPPNHYFVPRNSSLVLQNSSLVLLNDMVVEEADDNEKPSFFSLLKNYFFSALPAKRRLLEKA